MAGNLGMGWYMDLIKWAEISFACLAAYSYEHISNAFFATNYQIQIANTSTPLELRNNKDLLLNSVNFLTKREDSIRIRKDTGVVNFNTATASQDRAVKIFIFTFPVVLVIVGIIVTIIRKRKK